MTCCFRLGQAVLLFVMMFASLQTRGARADKRRVVLRMSRRMDYIAETADYGDQVRDYPRTNLMLPPEGYSDLCRYPESLVNVTDAESIYNYTGDRFPYGYPIALLVSMGGCQPEQKARVMLSMNQNLTSQLRYMFLYSIDPEDGDQLVRLTADSEEFPEEMRNIGILYFAYQSGQNMLGNIKISERYSERNPRLLEDGNRGWGLPADIEIYFGTRPPYDSPYRDRGEGNFNWIRFVLFALLIVSPCLRAGYLWYKAGGRVHVRRNEQGRVIGLQYIPPMRHWLRARALQRLEPVSRTLREEQVNALPEIEYQPPDDDGMSDKDEEEIVVATDVEAGESEVPTCTEDDQGVSTVSRDKKSVVEEASQADETESPSENPAVHPIDTEVSTDLTTNCTTCSICIDDFERGERLTLLPRCRHAFHKDCIMPWLTERQGCCPLCKTSVLEDEPQTSEESSAESSEEETGQQPEQEQQR